MPATGEHSPWIALWALVVGYFMTILDMTIVAVANPVIMTSLHADVSDVVWASSAYLLTFAALLLLAGRLGDHFGPKTVYLAGLVLFTVASLACGASTTIGMLIAARAVQGVGAALVTPQTMAVITRTFPAGARSAAMALWGAVAGFANLVGPIVGGALIDGPGWQWVFWVNVPIGVAGLAVAARWVPSLPHHRQRFDMPGVALSAAGIGLLVFGVQEGGSRHWDPTTGLVIASGLILLVIFAVHQRRAREEPLLPPAVFADRNFTLATVAVGAAGAAVAAVLVPLYFYVETVRGITGFRAALLLAPMAVLAILVVPVLGRFGDRFPPRLIPTTGFSLFAATLVCFAVLMTPDSPIAVFLLLSALAGIANACIWPTLAATATHNLPASRAGAGSGAYNAIRHVGSVLGAAAIAAAITQRLTARGLDQTALGAGARAPASAAARFGAALGDAMTVPIALLVVGAVASALLVGHGRTPMRAEHGDATDALPAPDPRTPSPR